MAFQLSPGVLVTEEDRTTVIPSVATTAGGISGAFKWGPVDEVITVDTENSLIDRFGRPDDTTAGYFFTSANFLSYGNNLKVVRVVDKSIARNAVSQPSGKVTSIQIVNSPNTYSILSDISVTIDSPVGEGIPATATAILSPSAIVSSITMTDNGYGYTIGQTLPEVTISGGGGSGATGRVVFGPGGIANVYIDFSGNNNTNLAIFSSAFHLGANPALMGFIVRPDSVGLAPAKLSAKSLKLTEVVESAAATPLVPASTDPTTPGPLTLTYAVSAPVAPVASINIPEAVFGT
jgi:hypothetical protein